MKKILIVLLFGLAYRKIRQDLGVRAVHWGRSAHWIPLDRDTVFAAINAAIDNPSHPSWESIRKADEFRARQRERAERLLEEGGDDGAA